MRAGGAVAWGEAGQSVFDPVQGGGDPGEGERAGGGEGQFPLGVGVPVQQPGGDPHPQRAAVFAERAGGQDAHAVAVQQVAGESLAGGHAVIGGQRAAPGAEARIEVEGGLRRGDIQLGGGEPARYGAADRRMQGPAAGDPFGKFRGSVKARAAACWTGAAVAD